MSNRTKPHYLKRVKFSLALPAWQRHLLATIDPKSNSNALARLINHAIKAGALHDLAPHLPPGLTDPGELAAYLTNQATQPHNAAPAQVETPPALETFATWDDPEPLNPIPQTLAATPALQSIWEKPADQLNDADLRELQHHAEASLLLNRPG